MADYLMKIRLLSDLCVADGGIYNSSIDTDICYDSYGLPFIPAKRIKGCLRECGIELRDWGEELPLEEIFGAEGNRAGKLIIRNAYLPERTTYVKEIRMADGSAVGHPQNVLHLFAYIRNQTSIEQESGVAKESSLRTMRVIKKGLEFTAQVQMPAIYETQVKDCCTILKHMGLARTRGFGDVEVTLEAVQKNEDWTKQTVVGENAEKLEYEIYLKDPMICKRVDGEEEKSMDYIEGAKLLGCISELLKKDGQESFAELCEKGKLRCSNAYLSMDGERLMEVPASLYAIKNDKQHYIDKLYEKEKTIEEKEPEIRQFNQMKHCYVYRKPDGTLKKYDVELEERYHHKRPSDKSVGRAMGNKNSDSEFYQMSSIKEGQTFRGFVEGSRHQIRRVKELFEKYPDCLLGYGRNAEYGGCQINLLNQKPEDGEIVMTDTICVLLKAPTIVYNQNAFYSTASRDLTEEICAALEISAPVEQVHKYLNLSVVGGYQVTWGCRKPVIGVFDKGTVLELKFAEPLNVKRQTIWLGERTSEGYGEAVVFLKDSHGTYENPIEKGQAANAEQSVDLENTQLLQQVAQNMFREYIGSQAVRAAEELINSFQIKNHTDALSPVISAMGLLIKDAPEEAARKQEEPWTWIRNNIEKRYKDKAGKAVKWCVSDEIMKKIEKNSHRLIESFSEEFSVSGLQYDDDLKLTYLKACLAQLKYLVRRDKTKQEEGKTHE